MRAAVRRSRSRPVVPASGSSPAPLLAHLLAILALVVAVLAPLAPLPVAARQTTGAPPPLPAPQQVAVVGSFQTAVGCPADYDPSCPQTQLSANGDNTFSAFVPVPPGDWAFRIAAVADQQRSLGEGGVPDAADLFLSVPAGSAGAVFAYDATTGEIVGEPVANQVEIATDFGDRLPLAPIQRGGYGVTFDAQPGVYGFQILVDGESVAQDQISLDQSRRVVVETDESGQITVLDTLRDAALTVAKTDEAGAPLAGACYAVSDGNRLLGQACDGDDGAEDGQTRIRFPNGIEPGRYELAETLTPDGQAAADLQRVDLGPGEATVAAVAAGETGAAPAIDGQDGQDGQAGTDGEQAVAGRLVVRVQDAAGDPLPGACASLVEFAFEACDDDGTGTIVFDGLPSGSYTVRETAPPAGLAPLPDQTVDLGDDGARVVFRHEDATAAQPAGEETPTATAEPDGADETPIGEPVTAEESGTLEIRTLAAVGGEALGACFAATNQETGERVEACDTGTDGDGASDNGVVQFLGLPPGRYAVEETTTPAGFAPSERETVEVEAGGTVDIEVVYQQAAVAGALGRLVIEVADEDGTPLGGTCFDLDGLARLDDVCDQGDDGRLNIPDLPAGAYLVRQVQAPEGFETADETAVTVPANDTVNLEVVNREAGAPEPDETATATAEPGSESEPTTTADIPGDPTDPTVEAAVSPPADPSAAVVAIEAVDASGAPAAGGCYGLLGPAVFDVCDEDPNDADPRPGLLRIEDVPPGQYDLFETRVPPGAEATTAGVALDVTPGEAFLVRFIPGEVPAAEAVGGGTATEAPPTEPTEDETGGIGIAVQDADGAPVDDACVTLDGPTPVDRLCDDGGEDELAEAGSILVTDLEPGDYAVSVAPPAGFATPEPQAVEVQAGEAATALFVLAAAGPEVGTLEILAEGPDGQPVGGACFNLAGPAAGPVCDDDDGDTNDEAGRIVLDDLPAGDYAVSVGRAPVGFSGGGDAQDATVAAGETATVTFAFDPAPTGSILVTVERGQGIEGGFCVDSLNGAVPGTPVCDDAAADGDPSPDRVLIEGVSPGDYGLVLTELPPAVIVPGAEEVTVEAEQIAEVAFTLEGEGPPPGTLVVRTEDAAGDPVPGACYDIAGEDAAGATSAPRCDDDGDGLVEFPDLAPGDYAVRQTTPADDAAPADPVEQTVAVAPGAETEVAFQTQAGFGTVDVRLTNAAGDQVGFCAELVGAESSGPVCDDGADDADPTPGTVRFAEVPVGASEIRFSQVPEPFAAPEPQPVTVARDETATVDVELQRGLGTLVLFVEDPAGEALPSTCVTLQLEDSGAPGEEICDQGDDGRLNLPDLPAGTYTVRQTRAAEGYEPAPELTVEVPQDATTEETVVLAQEATPAPPTATPEPAATATPEPTATGEPTEQPASPTAEPTDPATVTVVATATSAAGVAPTTTPVPTPTPEPAPPGSLAIVTVDADGDPLGLEGACYAVTGATDLAPVCDGDPDDADPVAGTVRLNGLATGAYTVAQTRAPDGFVVAATASVAVAPAAVTEVDLVNLPAPAETGSLVVAATGPGGDPIGGGCYRLVGADGETVAEACDNDRSDTRNDPGRVAFAGLAAGAYTVTQTRAPEGFTEAPERSIEVTGDAEAVVELAVEPLAPETGTVELQAIDEAGEPVEGQCFVLNSGTEQIGPLCDNGDRDADTAPGAVRVEDLPVGVYEAVLQAADAVPSDPDVAQATQRFIDRRTFTVERGGPVINVVVNVLRQRSDEGDLQIAKRDEAGRPLGGACFAVRDGGRTAAEVCDNERGDADGNVGGIRIQDLREGGYTLVETRAPQGYEQAADQPLRIAGDQTLRVTVRNTQVRDQTGELIVRTVDPDGDPVNGACYTLFQGARPLGPVCDDADGDDGEVTFGDLRPGAYLVRQTRTPAGYLGGNDTAVRVLAGERIEVEVVASPRPGSVLIRKTDDGGRALANACFSTIAVDGGAAYEVCDNDQNDANPAAGLILLNGIAAGDYDVRETRAPAGYRAAADQQVNVAAGARTDVTVRNSPLPPPAQRGSLVVTKTDADDRLLAGACWALLSGDVSAAARCDGDDGARDGITRFDGVGVGRYTLRETVRPSAAYEIAADTTVDVALDRTTRVSVVNELRPGRVLVRKTNPNGETLAGACFDLEGDNAGALCTDDAGRALFPDVAPGVYRLVETEAPAGYLAAAPLTGVEVDPGATTVLDVENAFAPPQPDTGSLQVVKFVCPAGEDGEGTFIYDSSNAGGGKLGRTVGCERGDARFGLIDLDGPNPPLEFATGADGRYQTTLRRGTYRLSELAPDLPGEAVEDVAVSVNQLTTVVVLNFVAPPPPASGSIEVVKFTCAPGLQGVLFEDFVNGCAENGALTNNVTVRVAGPVTARRVTGDGGEQGITRFANLPPGDYRVSEEVNPNVAQTVYSFCGLNPDALNLRGVGPTTDIRVGSGQTLVCYLFNVPDLVTETTGTIVVHKYACAANTYPPGFDWFGQCRPQGAGVRFAVSVFNGETFAPKATGATDADGILRFTDAAPGTYQLREIGAAWCRAESDSVDANGNVIVRAGERANVWIFNCVGTKAPPNTGAGPLALGATPPAAVSVAPLSGGVGGLALLWPVAGFGLLSGLRRWAGR